MTMRSPISRTARPGVTLIELMIALFLFVMVFGLAVPFFRFQARSVSQSSGRQDALQNARFAQNSIDRDLRIAGIGIVSEQPLIVQADKYAVTFNADLATADSTDPSSIYYDASVDSMATISMVNTSPVQLPRSVINYPDSNYSANSIPSRAETISYWVQLDTLAGRPDQYILFRRINATPARVVAKGIIIPAGQSFFTYFRPDSTGKLDSIRDAQLPIYHTAAIHGSTPDTGKSAWTDSIRVVRIVAWGLYHDPSKGDIIKKVESSSKLINSGMVRATMCGDVPLPATGQTATPVPGINPTKVVITWNSSIDQDNGEKDVERYMVFKRETTDPDWGEPIASVAASGASFSIDDTDVHTGEGKTWVWAVAAQDCSPANSALATTSTITIP
jgi:type II secretory pathway pseudopilin PulG